MSPGARSSGSPRRALLSITTTPRTGHHQRRFLRATGVNDKHDRSRRIELAESEWLFYLPKPWPPCTRRCRRASSTTNKRDTQLEGGGEDSLSVRAALGRKGEADLIRQVLSGRRAAESV